MADLGRRFLEEYVPVHCKPSTREEYLRSVKLFVDPVIGELRVPEVQRKDIAALHHGLRDKPYQANRTLGVLSKMFSLAEVWGWRPDGSNPCRHVKRYKEHKRERFLSPEETERLGQVLREAEEENKERKVRLYFRGDAAFASPEICEYLEAEGMLYAIRLPANKVLQESIAHLLRRPAGRPPNHVRRYYASFSYQAGSWDRRRRVVAKVEWDPGELYPRVGFIVTNLSRPTERVVAFYNQRGTAEQWIKEGKDAIKWTRLSCRRFRNNEVRLQLHALAYNLANFMRTLALPKEVEHWSLITLREKLVKIGAKVVRHGRYVTFQLAEVAVPRSLFQKILRLIDGLRGRPAPA